MSLILVGTLHPRQLGLEVKDAEYSRLTKWFLLSV